jgi:hypothetical protein
MISSYGLFVTTKTEIKQTGHDRLLCRSRLLRLYSGHPHPHQIDHPLHSPAALAGLPPIFYNPVLRHFGHPLAERPRHNISPPHVRHQLRINFRLAITVKTASR